MSNYEDKLVGKVTVGKITQVLFKYASGKKAAAFYDDCSESWIQETKTLMDPDVLDATFNALKDKGYV
jgi:hypothetical protein